jgi:glutathione S-transferase
MKLYSDDQSPYCAPVRAAIYAKRLPIAIEPPLGGLQTEAYRAASLTGTIPCLVLDDGSPLPESSVILDYLEERFPEPALQPADPEGRARVRLIRTLAQANLTDAMIELFHDLAHGAGDAARPKALARFERGLALLERLLPDDGFAAGPAFTAADCVLGPALMGVGAVSGMAGKPGLLAAYPRTAAYAGRIAAHPVVGKVLGEIQAALANSGLKLD